MQRQFPRKSRRLNFVLITHTVYGFLHHRQCTDIRNIRSHSMSKILKHDLGNIARNTCTTRTSCSTNTTRRAYKCTPGMFGVPQSDIKVNRCVWCSVVRGFHVHILALEYPEISRNRAMSASHALWWRNRSVCDNCLVPTRNFLWDEACEDKFGSRPTPPPSSK